MLTEKLFSRPFRLACALLVPLMLAGCGEKSAGPGITGDSDFGPVPSGPVHSFGDGQTGHVGDPLPRAVGISLLDERDHPVDGITVEFTVILGNGTVVNPVTKTDNNGTAKTVWILGTVSRGIQSISANIKGFDFDPIVFSATGLPGPGEFLTLLAGDSQAGQAGSPLPVLIVVRATDEYGNGVPNQLVKFSPNTGDGSMTPGDIGADEDGKAIAIWTLGAQAGIQEASIWSPGLTGSPVRILATAQ